MVCHGHRHRHAQGNSGAAREAHLRRDWQASYAWLRASAGIRAAGSRRLGRAGGRGVASGSVQGIGCFAEQVFAEMVRAEPAAAATKAVEVALAWLTRGDLNIDQGWMNRARRLLDGTTESPTHAYLAYLDAWIADLIGDADALAQKVAELRRWPTGSTLLRVTALGLVSEALVAIGESRVKDAFGLIDEAMLPVLADEVPIEWAGDIYCLVLHRCHRLADQPRMRAWTQSMTRWSEDIAASPTYGGLCEIHRLQLRAATDDYRTLEDKLVGRQLQSRRGQHLRRCGGLLPTRRDTPIAWRSRRCACRVFACTREGHRPAAG